MSGCNCQHEECPIKDKTSETVTDGELAKCIGSQMIAAGESEDPNRILRIVSIAVDLGTRIMEREVKRAVVRLSEAASRN